MGGDIQGTQTQIEALERGAEAAQATQEEHLKAIASLQEQETRLSEELRSARESGEELLKKVATQTRVWRRHENPFRGWKVRKRLLEANWSPGKTVHSGLNKHWEQ